MPRAASEAERLRLCRQAFVLAMELRCTPKEAEEELRRREAMAADRATCARLAARMNSPLPRPAAVPSRDDAEPFQPWMMRD